MALTQFNVRDSVASKLVATNDGSRTHLARDMFSTPLPLLVAAASAVPTAMPAHTSSFSITHLNHIRPHNDGPPPNPSRSHHTTPLMSWAQSFWKKKGSMIPCHHHLSMSHAQTTQRPQVALCTPSRKSAASSAEIQGRERGLLVL